MLGPLAKTQEWHLDQGPGTRLHAGITAIL